MELKPIDKMTAQEVHQATIDTYNRLSQATTAYLTAKYNLASAVQDLDAIVATALHRQEIYGRNETERDGHARELFPDKYQAVASAKQALLHAEIELQQAKLDETYLITGIRVFEILGK